MDTLNTFEPNWHDLHDKLWEMDGRVIASCNKQIDYLRKEVEQLKLQLIDAIERLDRHHVCGYVTGNQPEPCPTCEFIKHQTKLYK